ncbi:MAG TPA: SDR family oxidoreductase [Candidatus Methylomirabilis sp.]|nr:SDR family oxidoreductase [Candidatus Methylomirabilis sp.]HSC71882.1 SDR family oxidoreductase [Candidatus Methylomirabilis sp.]
MDNLSLRGKVAVVTGGTRGIGRAVGAALLTRGANVLICGRSAAEAERVAADLTRHGPGKCAGTVCDVRRYDQVEALMRHAGQTLGGLDVLVNNAGIAGRGAVADIPLELWHAVIDTNLTGVFYCCRAAVPWMRKRGGGYIINIGSLAGVNPIPNLSAYNASKFGLVGFSEAFMQEIRYDGIRVSTILPGSVDTEFGGRTPGQEGWRLAPEDVAAVVVQLLAHEPRSLPSRVEIRPSMPPKKG